MQIAIMIHESWQRSHLALDYLGNSKTFDSWRATAIG